MKVRINLSVLISLVILFPALLFAQEQLVITTYYPSPSGTYRDLGTDRLAVNVSGDLLGNRVAVPSEYQAMQVGDAHIGWSMVIGSGGGSGWAYDELRTGGPTGGDIRPGDGVLLVKNEVGIGTTEPQSPLHINDAGAVHIPSILIERTNQPGGGFSPRLGLVDTSQGSVSSAPMWAIDNELDQFRIFRQPNISSVGAARLLINNTGNVGIGTTTPAARLEIQGSGNTNATNSLIIRDGNNVETMRVTDNHNVGIGTSNPLARLEVTHKGATAFANIAVFDNAVDLEGNNGVYIHTQNNSVNTYALDITTGDASAPTEIFYARSDGSVGIGTTTPQGTLDIIGTAFCTSGAWSGSDLRWKKNIETLTSTEILNKLLKLRGVRFEWKTAEFPKMRLPKGKQIGVIAQELEKEFPELVSTGNNGYKAIAYEKFTGILLEAIKAQENEIRDLRKEIKELKNKIK